MTKATIGRAQDVVDFLHAQHEQIKQLFSEVLAAEGAQRQDKFVELRRLLAVHETAEEEIVHPKARKELTDGDSLVAARLNEERSAKETLQRLEQMHVDSAEFEETLRTLQQDVLDHAQAEETEEFAKLEQELDADELERMRRSVDLAERTAPTRPHPGIESAAANILAGPFAAMIDRARDAISGKH